MAIENNKSLVQFGYGFNEATSKTAGMISFDPNTQAIYVGDDENANLVTSSVKDATFAENILTITKINGDKYTLDFSDVASATGVSMNFKALDERVTAAKNVADDASTAAAANATAIVGLSGDLNDLDAAYKLADSSIRTDFVAADTELSNRITAVETAIGENGSVATQIESAINALDSSKDATDASGFVTVKVDIVDGKLSENGVKVSTADIAKASDLSAHAGNGDIHVTKTEKERWTAAAEDVENFFNGALEDGAEQVKDTLKEIQDYIASDATAAAEMTASIKAAKDAADAAQADANAVEAVLGSGFTEETTVSAQLAAVKTTADAAAVKTSVDASLALKADKSALETVTDSYVSSFGGAKGAISVDTDNNTNGAVKFTMDASTLKGTVNGLGTAAFTNTNAYATADQGTKANTAIQGVTAETPELNNTDYVAVHASEDETTHEVTLSSSVKVQAVADAAESAKGLAEASDVKAYVDSKVTSAALTWTVL